MQDPPVFDASVSSEGQERKSTVVVPDQRVGRTCEFYSFMNAFDAISFKFMLLRCHALDLISASSELQHSFYIELRFISDFNLDGLRIAAHCFYDSLYEWFEELNECLRNLHQAFTAQLDAIREGREPATWEESVTPWTYHFDNLCIECTRFMPVMTKEIRGAAESMNSLRRGAEIILLDC